MKFEDLKTKISAIVADIDKNGGDLPALLDEIEQDYTERDTLRTEGEKSAEKIRDLQTTNHKLFLSITKGTTDDGTEPDDGDDDLTGEEAAAAFWARIEKKEED